MTQYLIDIASHQDAKPAIGQKELDLSVAKQAGYSLVNIKTSQGNWYTYTKAPVWAARARSLGMGISTFHWLDNTASGATQAAIAYQRMVDMGGPDGMAHQCDCEDNATETIWRDYVNAMQDKLGRPIVNYTGDWWWQPRGWTGANLTPYLWAAPNKGYLTTYPGDASAAWMAGYGGWSTYSLLQFAVSTISGAGGGALSKTAIRDAAVWAALTGPTGEDTVTPAEFAAILDDPAVAAKLRSLPWTYTGGGAPAGLSTLATLTGIYKGLGAVDDAVLARMNELAAAEQTRDAAQDAAIADVDEQVVARLGSAGLSAQEAADLLRPILGEKATQVGTLLAQA